jgi:hypothetical protein
VRVMSGWSSSLLMDATFALPLTIRLILSQSSFLF